MSWIGYYPPGHSAGAWRRAEYPWLVVHRVSAAQTRLHGWRGWRVVPHAPGDREQWRSRCRLLAHAQSRALFDGCYPTRRAAWQATQALLS